MADQVEVAIKDGELSNLRFVVRGGETGAHYVVWNGEWSCDCQGFGRYEKCRHVKGGEILRKYVAEGIAAVNRSEHAWK